MFTRWIEWLGNSPLAIYIQEDAIAFPMLEVLHVISIALVVGSIFIVDLRLMNLAGRTYPISRLMRAVLPLTIIAFLSAATTGFLMFSSQPARYLATAPFVIKLVLLALAVVNMGVFHVWSHRRVAGWDTAVAMPVGARAAGAISFVLWIAILVAGRFVGFMLDS